MIARSKQDRLSRLFPEPQYRLSRAYNPTIGRFESMDTISVRPGDAQNSNLYDYVAGNPVNSSDPSGHMGVADFLISFGVNATLNAVTYGSIRFAFAKARGLSTAAAFKEGLETAGWGVVMAVPIVGQIVSGIFLAQTAVGLANGSFSDMDKLELATYLTAALILGRAGPRITTAIRGARTPEPPVGTKLPIPQRLAILFGRLSGDGTAKSPQDAMKLLASQMKSVEDSYSGVPENPNPGLAGDGRMYPPQPDNVVTYPDGTWYLKTRGHRLLFDKWGGITVINRATGNIDYQDGPKLPATYYTNHGGDDKN